MEKNFVIYKELVKAAAKVFDEGITAPVGTYTLSELSKIGTTAKTAPKGVYFHKGYNADNIINIIVDGFKCSLPAYHIFLIARRFETLAKVGAKDRAAFTRAMKHGELVAVFTLDAVTVENLAACEDPHQGIRPQMQGVFCDISAGLSCCSDGYALNVARLPDAQVMNAEHVAPRRVLSDWLKVAAVLLLAFVLRSISTSDSEAAAPSTNSRAAVVDVEPLQVVEILDTLDVAPVVPVDSIQTVETADTLHVAPVAPAKIPIL
nr:MAG TPA: hypothetical protein [Caudoviricetes sp.]